MSNRYSRSNPFFAKITERTPLCHEITGKEIHHLVVDVKGSGITYEVGDCLAVLPLNHPDRVKRLLSILRLREEDLLHDLRAKERVSAAELFARRLNINDCPLSLVKKLAESSADENLLEFMDDKEKVKSLDLLELLEEAGEAALTGQEVIEALRPLMPRFYSIASSMEAVGEEIHLTVALDQRMVEGRERPGVCTDYLCRQASLHEHRVAVYLHPHRGFTLPDSHDVPIIMVGPGTGIAPFRGFMQQRERIGKYSRNWLFFGDWTRDKHFFYREYWEGLAAKGILKLDLAFSRDQQEKIYVQHRMREKGRELVDWLEEGAYFYVCGNASRMAKDVDCALHQVLQEQGGLSEDAAKAYVKKMRADKRYLRDVY